ncbi:unknown [Crocosphaera subtropica ATCC 51142]|uniref:Putative restriction endonuclease domain-containing protein n=1 Tax=Crocosphaera subtropica (strain ATCC 51142 / BH68) TaxID=43989 RepID=B1WV45_CROS5|nr:Uma2 family endonuclease [Crocosphaera subtropica]ACB52242.1 unknown [Crocosphaera subtropica ATCC 51142]
MIEAKISPKLMTFSEFLDWKPENSCYELHKGVVIAMQPKGKHEEISGFLAVEFACLFRQKNLDYFLPKQAIVKVLNENTGYLPDVLVVDRNVLEEEPLWEEYSTLTKGKSIPLVIEIVSSNWRDDYLTKLRDYEEIGINEYWIVDYLGIGGSRYIGNPKKPTISIYNLIDGEYQVKYFRDNEKIKSLTFPELELTVNQIF